jgi:hypothetical protein
VTSSVGERAEENRTLVSGSVGGIRGLSAHVPANSPCHEISHLFGPCSGVAQALPLAMTEGGMVDIFPTEWRLNAWDPKEWPGPLGLCLGLGAVVVGKVFLILYHYLQLHGTFGPQLPIQAKGAGSNPNICYPSSLGVSSAVVLAGRECARTPLPTRVTSKFTLRFRDVMHKV